MTKTKLLFELIMYVNTKRNFTAQDIANEFNISVRTAHRYLMKAKHWQFFSLFNQKRSVSSPFLTDIIEASIENHILIIGYLSKSQNKVKKVKPIGVYAYNGLWYMPAFDIENNAVRLFRIDRILSLKNSKVVRNVSISLADWFNIHTVKIPLRLYVKLTREGLRQCRSEPWLEPHIVITSPDNGYIDTEIDKSEIEFVTSYFFQLGTEAKVIEPQEIIDNIKERAHNIINHYHK